MTEDRRQRVYFARLIIAQSATSGNYIDDVAVIDDPKDGECPLKMLLWDGACRNGAPCPKSAFIWRARMTDCIGIALWVEHCPTGANASTPCPAKSMESMSGSVDDPLRCGR